MEDHVISDYWLDISWGEDAIDSGHLNGFREKQKKKVVEDTSQFLHPPELCWHGVIPGLCLEGCEFPEHHLFKSHFKWILLFRFSILSICFMSYSILSTIL